MRPTSFQQLVGRLAKTLCLAVLALAAGASLVASPASASSLSVTGDALVIPRSDHVLVAVDRTDGVEDADGMADIYFVHRQETAGEEADPWQGRAYILLRDGVLELTGHDGSFRARLGLADAPAREVAADWLLRRDQGYELTTYTPSPETRNGSRWQLSLTEIATDPAITGLIEGGVGPRLQESENGITLRCKAGGLGSTSCSVDCGGEDSCQTTCSAPYFSCCRCERGIATCRCFKEGTSGGGNPE